MEVCPVFFFPSCSSYLRMRSVRVIHIYYILKWSTFFRFTPNCEIRFHQRQACVLCLERQQCLLLFLLLLRLFLVKLVKAYICFEQIRSYTAEVHNREGFIVKGRQVFLWQDKSTGILLELELMFISADIPKNFKVHV